MATVGIVVPQTLWPTLVLVSTVASATLMLIGLSPALALGIAIDVVLVWLVVGVCLGARHSSAGGIGTPSSAKGSLPMVNLAVATVLFAHGVGHVLFLAPTLRLADWAGQTGYSWALAPVWATAWRAASAPLCGPARWFSSSRPPAATSSGRAGGGRSRSLRWRVRRGHRCHVERYCDHSASLALVADFIVVAALIWSRSPVSHPAAGHAYRLWAQSSAYKVT